jgi:protein required for attachment to host cells
MKTWVLVANRSRATLYLHPGPGKELTPVREFDHPEGRLKDREIDTDRAGRADHPDGGAKKSAYQRNVEPHEHLAQQFGKELAEVLNRGRNDHEYENLVLVAEPHFLGVLKASLDSHTNGLVRGTLSSDLTRERPEGVAARLGEFLPV